MMKSTKSTKLTKPNRLAAWPRALSLFAYLIVPVFFAILYLTMTMNYEDLYQRAAGLNDNIFTIWHGIYHWLPRIGEIYQRTAIHFMTPQLSLGLDPLVRLLTASMASGLVYLLAMFVLGRRPRLRPSDALIYLGLFICLLLLDTGEIFTFNFSYAHNYVIAGLLLVAFVLPYRLQVTQRHPAALLGMLLLGILVGMSSEIIPIALLLILIGFAVQQLKSGRNLRYFWQNYRLQIIGAIGLICGIGLYYLGAGLGSRINGGYGALYDYVSPFGILSAPIHTIYKLFEHLFYNLRHLHFAVILMLLILLLEYARYRRHQAHHLALQVGCFIFCVLYLGAASLLAVHDDLYPRFMSPVYLTVLASSWLYASDYLLSPQIFTARTLQGCCLIAVAVSVLMTVDLTYATIRYHFTARPYLQEIVVDAEFYPIFEPALTGGEQDMHHSPIFQFRQSSPFHWPYSCNCG